MPITKLGSDLDELVVTGFDTNSSGAVTAALDISDSKLVALGVSNTSGGSSTHVVTLQCSFDNVVWITTQYTQAGEGINNNIPIIVRFIRAKVTTPEGSASTSTITLQAK